MSRRHERARRDHDDAQDPHARVIRHPGYECIVVEAGPLSPREKAARLDAATAHLEREEQAEAQRIEDHRYDG